MSRRVRVTFETDKNHVDTLVSLLKDEITNFSFVEVPNGKHSSRTRNDKNMHWVDRFYPAIIKLLETKKEVAYSDPTLIKTLGEIGCNPASVSSLLALLARQGKLVRPKRGIYALPPKK